MVAVKAKMLRSCEHRRIIGYRSLLKLPPTPPTSSAEPVWALVMEFAKHGDLSQRIVRQMVQPNSRQYDTLQALSWALDAGSALEYLHLRTPAVLHRDDKSANIMLTAEEGRLVAKLSDFGLHVTADSSRYSAVQSSSFHNAAALGVKDGKVVPSSPPVLVIAAPTPDSSASTSIRTAEAAVGCSKDVGQGTSNTAAEQGISAGKYDPHTCAPSQPPQLSQQQQQQQQPSTVDDNIQQPAGLLTAAEHHIYSEVHDSGGSRVFVDTHSTAKTASAEQQQQRHSYTGSSTSSTASAVVQRRRPAQRNNSFRRAAHHPPGDALPRLALWKHEASNNAASKDDSANAAASGADNAVLFAHWRDQVGGGSSTGGSSVCSLATDGTWVTGGTGASGTDTAGSDCTDDTAGSIYDELETVFDLTGHTGSCLYMAPEVYLNQSYNEKSDVFSFGVVLYELMARTLVVFTELPQHSKDPLLPMKYAAKVAGGYRPSQPKSVPDPIWALISACWQQDPVLRPHMSEVVAVLSKAVADAASQQQSSRSFTSSLRLSKRNPSVGSQQQHAATNRSAAASSAASDGRQSSQPAGGCSSAGDADVVGAANTLQQGSGQEAAASRCGCVIC